MGGGTSNISKCILDGEQIGLAKPSGYIKTLFLKVSSTHHLGWCGSLFCIPIG